ncbi:MAG: hypothetical protein LUE91_04375 [Oscillospiraceae bacterium]|nr:hypothetical protein [Oscillospiraceae bacterium]
MKLNLWVLYDWQLAARVRYFRESEGGREHMCKFFEDMINDAVKEKNKLMSLGWHLSRFRIS